MSTDTTMLLLTEREADVVEEALSLYLSTRPAPADTRYDYRYRAARSVLGSLQGNRMMPERLREDGDAPTRSEDDHPRRPKREQLED